MPHLVGTICHENNGVMSALTVTVPPTSLVRAVPGPTTATEMHQKDLFVGFSMGTRRKMPGEASTLLMLVGWESIYRYFDIDGLLLSGKTFC